MAKLSRTLEHQSGESPSSFLSRLAMKNGIASAREFAADMGLSFQAVADGDTDALMHLAHLSAGSFESLADHALRAIDRRTHLFRTEHLPKTVLRRVRLQVCPRCLASDIERSTEDASIAVFGRTIWSLSFYRICVHHGSRMVEVCPQAGPGAAHDIARQLHPIVPRLAEMVKDGDRRPPSSFDRYVHKRLEAGHGDVPDTWPDKLSLHALARTAEVFGAVDQHGKRPRVTSFTEAERADAAAAGFAVLEQGQEAIHNFLGELVAGHSARRRPGAGPQAFLGHIYTYLAYQAPSPDFDPVREVVRDYIIENLPIAPGEDVLGQPAPCRRIHSVRTASLEYGLHSKRLRKVLAAKGIVPSYDSGLLNAHATFDAHRAANLLEALATSISETQMQKYLNVPRVHARLLVDHGFIKPIADDDGIGSTYALADLDAFLAELLARAQPVDAVPEEAATIPAAAKRCCRSAVEVLRLIKTGTLEWSGQLCGERGYLSVLVSIPEVRSKLHSQAEAGIPLRRLEERLGLPSTTVRRLIETNAIRSRTVRNPVNLCPQTIVPHDAFREFAERYITLRDLSRLRRRNPRTLKHQLAEAGILPAFDPDIYGGTIYLRESV